MNALKSHAILITVLLLALNGFSTTNSQTSHSWTPIDNVIQASVVPCFNDECNYMPISFTPEAGKTYSIMIKETTGGALNCRPDQKDQIVTYSVTAELLKDNTLIDWQDLFIGSIKVPCGSHETETTTEGMGVWQWTTNDPPTASVSFAGAEIEKPADESVTTTVDMECSDPNNNLNSCIATLSDGIFSVTRGNSYDCTTGQCYNVGVEFTSLGTKIIYLTATDTLNASYTASDTIDVKLQAIGDPTATLNVDKSAEQGCKTPTEPFTFTVKCYAGENAALTACRIEYEDAVIEFPASGQQITATDNKSFSLRQGETASYYTAKAQACQDDGKCSNRDDASVTVCVSETIPPEKPTASITVVPECGAKNTTDFTFSVSCNDNDGTITSCLLDYGDNSSIELVNENFQENTSIQKTHRYSSTGTFTATITAKDNDNQTTSKQTTVQVKNTTTECSQNQDKQPNCSIDLWAIPSYDKCKQPDISHPDLYCEVPEEEPVNINVGVGYSCGDPEGQICGCSFVDYRGSSTNNSPYNLTAYGNYGFSVTATDCSYNQRICTRFAIIEKTNKKPIASLEMPNCIEQPQNVNIDVNCFDPDGIIKSCKVYFNDSNLFDYNELVPPEKICSIQTDHFGKACTRNSECYDPCTTTVCPIHANACITNPNYTPSNEYTATFTKYYNSTKTLRLTAKDNEPSVTEVYKTLTVNQNCVLQQPPEISLQFTHENGTYSQTTTETIIEENTYNLTINPITNKATTNISYACTDTDLIYCQLSYGDGTTETYGDPQSTTVIDNINETKTHNYTPTADTLEFYLIAKDAQNHIAQIRVPLNIVNQNTNFIPNAEITPTSQIIDLENNTATFNIKCYDNDDILGKEEEGLKACKISIGNQTTIDLLAPGGQYTKDELRQGIQLNHEFTQTGTYTVTLRADDNATYEEVTATVIVLDKIYTGDPIIYSIELMPITIVLTENADNKAKIICYRNKQDYETLLPGIGDGLPVEYRVVLITTNTVQQVIPEEGYNYASNCTANIENTTTIDLSGLPKPGIYEIQARLVREELEQQGLTCTQCTRTKYFAAAAKPEEITIQEIYPLMVIIILALALIIIKRKKIHELIKEKTKQNQKR